MENKVLKGERIRELIELCWFHSKQCDEWLNHFNDNKKVGTLQIMSISQEQLCKDFPGGNIFTANCYPGAHDIYMDYIQRMCEFHSMKKVECEALLEKLDLGS